MATIFTQASGSGTYREESWGTCRYYWGTDKNGNKYDQSGAISIGNIIIWLVRTIGQSVSVLLFYLIILTFSIVF